MGKNSPTQRSLKILREAKWTCQITEKWNPFAKVRQDLFGFCDILCMCPVRGIMAVQTTSGGNVSARVNKIIAEPRARMFLESGGSIRVHGWAKMGGRGQKKDWICRTIEIKEEIFK